MVKIIGWVPLLWSAMTATGNGYRRDTLKNRPPKGASKWRGERRKDKVELAAKEALQPICTGKINFTRTEQRAMLAERERK